MGYRRLMKKLLRYRDDFSNLFVLLISQDASLDTISKINLIVWRYALHLFLLITINGQSYAGRSIIRRTTDLVR